MQDLVSWDFLRLYTGLGMCFYINPDLGLSIGCGRVLGQNLGLYIALVLIGLSFGFGCGIVGLEPSLSIYFDIAGAWARGWF